MTTTICGHGRDALIWALRAAAALPQQDIVTLRFRFNTSVASDVSKARNEACAQILDPAKLAELMAEEGRRLGFDDMVVLPGLSLITNYPKAVVWLLCDLVAVEVGAFHSGPKRIHQARAILLQWLQLPDGARDDALLVLRGSHGA